jgi:PIN domain nuclease of toxin-antitoxin system
MTKYILDTHVLIWFLEENRRLNKNVREDIEYFQHEYFISFLSLIEIDNLNKLGKVQLKYSFDKLIERLQKSYIAIHWGFLPDFANIQQ